MDVKGGESKRQDLSSSIMLGRAFVLVLSSWWFPDRGKSEGRCYDLPQNPVLELRKRCINQDETGFLLPPTDYYIY